MNLFLWASAAMVFCTAVLCGLARLYHRDGRALVASAALLAAAGLLTLRLGGQLPFWLSDVMVMLTGGLIGWFIARTIPGLQRLVGLMAAAAVIDVVSFYLGPARQQIMEAAQRGSPILQYLSFSLPYRGVVQPMVGVGDLVFLGAIYYTLARERGVPVGAYFLPLLALEAALVAGLLAGGIPALPFLAVAVYVARVAQRRRLAA